MIDQRRRWGVKAALLLTCAAPHAYAADVLSPVQVEGAAPKQIETGAEITAKEIDRKQPLTLQKLFRDEPSVQVPSGSMAAQKLFVHGIDQNKLNVTIDGAAQRNNMWHHNGNMTLDPTFLKSVEVDAGVSAADAGPGALGGAVRFTTKDAVDMLAPGRTMGGQAILGYDTNSQTWKATGAAFAAKDGFDLLAIASRAKGDDYKNGAGKHEVGTSTDFVSGLAKLGFTANGHKLQGSVEHARDEGVRRLRPNMGIIANPTGALMNYTEATRTTVTLNYEATQTTDLFAPKASFYYNDNDLKRPNDNRRPTAHGDFNAYVKSIGGKLQNTFVIPTGTLTAGVDFYRDKAFVERFHYRTNADEEVEGVGAFLQARLTPLANLRLSAGVRADHQNYRSVDHKTFKNSGLSPNLSAEYDLTKQITAFGGYSYNWGGLELTEVALYHAGNYRYADNLKPTTAHNFRGGLRFVDGGLSLEAVGFKTMMENPMAWNYAAYTRINGRDLVSHGVELAASYQWANARVGAKYVHTTTKYGGRMALPGDYSTAVPVGNLINLNGEYTFADARLTVGGSAEIALKVEDQALSAAGFRPLDQYTVVNLFADWTPMAQNPEWTLRVAADNLFDQHYSSRATYAQTAAITPVYSPGRTFYLSSSLKF